MKLNKNQIIWHGASQRNGKIFKLRWVGGARSTKAPPPRNFSKRESMRTNATTTRWPWPTSNLRRKPKTTLTSMRMNLCRSIATRAWPKSKNHNKSLASAQWSKSTSSSGKSTSPEHPRTCLWWSTSTKASKSILDESYIAYSVLECQILNECLAELAPKHPNTKFIRSVATKCVENF